MFIKSAGGTACEQAVPGLWGLGTRVLRFFQTVNKIRLLKYVLQSLRMDKLYLLEKKKIQRSQIHFK